jgi:hypothetical protein
MPRDRYDDRFRDVELSRVRIEGMAGVIVLKTQSEICCQHDNHLIIWHEKIMQNGSVKRRKGLSTFGHKRRGK